METGFHLDRKFGLSNGFNLLGIPSDIHGLGRYLVGEKAEIVHTNLSHDHVVTGLAARWSSPTLPIVHSDHKAMPRSPGPANRLVVNRLTDGLITFSRKARARDVAALGIETDRVALVSPAVDLDRFRPEAVRPGARVRFGITPDAPVAGIVARIQRHRRFDMLLEAVALARREVPDLMIMIVGRGTAMEELAQRPAREMGLGPSVIFTGYRTGEDYVDLLGCFDFKVFLVPGSDGTCRAVREAMAMGLPAVVTRRGILPELVEDRVSGLVADERPGALAAAMVKLARDRPLREAMGRAARVKARRMFSVSVQARQIEAFYEKMLRLGPRRGRP